MTSRKGTIPYEGRITADCHIHTEFSSDSETKITDQVERAIALGLDHICFTDHMDMDYPEGEFELDTDAYVKRVLGLVQITRDHSWIAEMVMRGELSKEEARNHPDKNIITRALGASEEVDIDFFDVQLEEKNRILLCSDGLSNMVADEEIQKILGDSPDIVQSGRQLVATANTNGGRDNISVILIEPFTNEVKEC